MKKILDFIKRPIPMWLLVPLLFFVAVPLVAAPPIWYGGLNLNGGTIVDPSASPNTCVGVNGSGQYVYGSNCSNGSSPCPTCAVTNANNNFSTQQNITQASGFLVLSGGGTSGVESSAGILDLVGVPVNGGTGLTLDTEQATPGLLVGFQKQGVNVSSIDPSGNYQKNTAPFITCTAGTGVPCTFSWSCSIGVAGSSCSTTQSVPASARCTLELTTASVVASTGILTDESLSSTTLTINARSIASIAAGDSVTGVGTCL